MTNTLRLRSIMEDGVSPVIRKIKSELQGFTKTGQDFVKAYGGVAPGVAANFEQAQRAAARLTGELGRIGHHSSRVLEIFKGLALYRGFGVITRQLKDFLTEMMALEKELYHIKVLFNETDNMSLHKIRDQVLDVAKATGVLVQDAAEAYYSIVSAGFKGEDAYNMLMVSAKMAQIEQADLNTVVESLISTMNNFGLSADKVNDIYGKQIELVKRGVATYDQLVSTIPEIAAAAGRTGQSLESMNAAMETLSKFMTGTSWEQGATTLKRMYEQIPTAGFQAELWKNWRIQVVDANGEFRDMIDIFTDLSNVIDVNNKVQVENAMNMLFTQQRARRAGAILLREIDLWKRYNQEQGASTETIKKKWEEVQNATYVTSGRMKATVRDALKGIMDVAERGAYAFAGLVNGLRGMSKVLYGIAAAVGAYAIAWGIANAVEKKYATTISMMNELEIARKTTIEQDIAAINRKIAAHDKAVAAMQKEIATDGCYLDATQQRVITTDAEVKRVMAQIGARRNNIMVMKQQILQYQNFRAIQYSSIALMGTSIGMMLAYASGHQKAAKAMTALTMGLMTFKVVMAAINTYLDAYRTKQELAAIATELSAAEDEQLHLRLWQLIYDYYEAGKAAEMFGYKSAEAAAKATAGTAAAQGGVAGIGTATGMAGAIAKYAGWIGIIASVAITGIGLYYTLAQKKQEEASEEMIDTSRYTGKKVTEVLAEEINKGNPAVINAFEKLGLDAKKALQESFLGIDWSSFSNELISSLEEQTKKVEDLFSQTRVEIHLDLTASDESRRELTRYLESIGAKQTGAGWKNVQTTLPLLIPTEKLEEATKKLEELESVEGFEIFDVKSRSAVDALLYASEHGLNIAFTPEGDPVDLMRKDVRDALLAGGKEFEDTFGYTADQIVESTKNAYEALETWYKQQSLKGFEELTQTAAESATSYWQRFLSDKSFEQYMKPWGEFIGKVADSKEELGKLSFVSGDLVDTFEKLQRAVSTFDLVKNLGSMAVPVKTFTEGFLKQTLGPALSNGIMGVMTAVGQQVVTGNVENVMTLTTEPIISAEKQNEIYRLIIEDIMGYSTLTFDEMKNWSAEQWKQVFMTMAGFTDEGTEAMKSWSEKVKDFSFGDFEDVLKTLFKASGALDNAGIRFRGAADNWWRAGIAWERIQQQWKALSMLKSILDLRDAIKENFNIEVSIPENALNSIGEAYATAFQVYIEDFVSEMATYMSNGGFWDTLANTWNVTLETFRWQLESADLSGFGDVIKKMVDAGGALDAAGYYFNGVAGQWKTLGEKWDNIAGMWQAAQMITTTMEFFNIAKNVYGVTIPNTIINTLATIGQGMVTGMTPVLQYIADGLGNTILSKDFWEKFAEAISINQTISQGVTIAPYIQITGISPDDEDKIVEIIDNALVSEAERLGLNIANGQ